MGRKLEKCISILAIGYTLCFGFLVGLAGCGKGPKPSSVVETTMNSAAIEIFMSEKNIMPIQGYAIADGVYALPSQKWIDGKYSMDLKSFQFELKSGKWVTESNDCDDFARGAAHFAQILHHNTPNDQRVGLLFGEFWYYKDDGRGGHAINFSIVNDPETKQPQLIFYEPQTQQRIVLSTNEVWNCIHWRL